MIHVLLFCVARVFRPWGAFPITRVTMEDTNNVQCPPSLSKETTTISPRCLITHPHHHSFEASLVCNNGAMRTARNPTFSLVADKECCREPFVYVREMNVADLGNVARREQGTIVQIKKEPATDREASYGDLPVSLKLGKRAYFREVDGGEGNNYSSAGNRSHSSAGNGDSSAPTNNVVKKHKVSPPSALNVPRCQAEDCRIDLSNAKDYHRRHKVCEWHAKSSKAKVANVDQRFCQQCSRFHVLSEFDEGKRSCRRRLAGHNERRRKQHPEPFSLLSAANYAYFASAKHLFGASLLDSLCLSNHEHVAAELKALKLHQKPREELTETIRGLELHEFMQNSKRRDEHLLVAGNAKALVLSGGNGIDLISTPAPLTTLTSCLNPNLPQPLPETLVSGRALSLLSSLGFPSTNPVSTPHGVSSLPAMPSSPASLEGQVLETHRARSHLAPGLMSFSEKVMEVLPHSHSHEVSGLSDSAYSGVGYCPSMNQAVPSPMLNFGGSSMFSILLEGDVQSSDTCPVPDHVQVSLSRPRQQRHRVEHHFMDMEGLSIFGRQGLM